MLALISTFTPAYYSALS